MNLVSVTKDQPNQFMKMFLNIIQILYIWKEQEKVFTFPSGARMEFGYCDSLDDLERYRGQEYTWIGIDEVAIMHGGQHQGGSADCDRKGCP